MGEKPIIAVALSGGVDSSVAAALLKDQGHLVKGIMLRLWDVGPDENVSIERQGAAISRAQNVCDRLSIPFEVIDVAMDFKKLVVDYFIQSLHSGFTPNPCFVCNKFIKWGLLLDFAIDKGASYLATGHYARVLRLTDGSVKLYKGIDPRKDQSYVLAGLSQAQLSKAILPLGNLTKQEVREIAHRLGFVNYNQADSQDLCFLGQLKQNEFLELYGQKLKTEGEIRNNKGELLGIHHGLSGYTIGQRKGIGSGHSEPFYVIEKDSINNLLIVGTKSQLGSKRITINGSNWIARKPPNIPSKFEIKIRYKSIPALAILTHSISGEYDIIFEEKIRDATPGQFAVFYEGEKVIGSGVITKVYGGEQ